MMDLVRLAIPRRTYTQSHADYIVEAFGELAEVKDNLRGFRIDWEPKLMRHFSCQFEPLA
jgi:tryptophanase